MSLTCPKCASEMRSYERNRVLVDQCTGCGGLFLDKGELEQLAAAENAWHQQQSVPAAPAAAGVQDTPRYDAPRHEAPRYEAPRYEGRGDGRYEGRGDGRYDSRYDPRYDYRHKKRKSFLSELFDD